MIVAWVIGRRGLLGGAVESAMGRRPDWSILSVPPISWNDASAIDLSVSTAIEQLLAESDRRGAQWAIVWAAGAAVTTSTQERLDEEIDQLAAIFATISRGLRAGERGAVFYASSAGGVYGGSDDPPFTESTVPRPISPYGAFKLRAEKEIEAFARGSKVSSLIGRISNLYGTGQRLDKMQGLISHLARAQFSSNPTTIYVPLDTIRDYLYVADGAEMILDSIEHLLAKSRSGGPIHATKIFASGSAVTIGTLLGHFRAVTKKRPNVMLARSGAAALQAHDLRVRSTVWPQIDARDLTPLPAGIRTTIDDLLIALQAGPL